MSRIFLNVRKDIGTILGVAVVALWSFSVWLSLLGILGYYHEIGHALMASAFGIRIIRITSEQIVMEEVINPLARATIGLFGGFFEGLLTGLMFLVVDFIAKNPASYLVRRYRLLLVVILSLEIALLTHMVSGLVKGLAEGLLTGFYSAHYNNTVFWFSLFGVTAVFLSLLLFRRWKVAWASGRWKIRRPPEEASTSGFC